MTPEEHAHVQELEGLVRRYRRRIVELKGEKMPENEDAGMNDILFQTSKGGSRRMPADQNRPIVPLNVGGMQGAAQIEMPRYRCHKEVHALKIKSIQFDHDAARLASRETDGSATIEPEEPRYAPFKVDGAYVRKHDPKVGGYYVVYKDGYQSFSPADAFEDGYTRI